MGGGRRKAGGGSVAASDVGIAPSVGGGTDVLDLVTPLGAGFWERVGGAGGAGVPVLAAGEDLEDMTLVVACYKAPGGMDERMVLQCKVRPEAEAKLLDAVHTGQPRKAVVKRVEEREGPLPLDEERGLYAALVETAKSINRHLKEGSAVPDATLEKLATLEGTLHELKQGGGLGAQEQAMVGGYLQAVAETKGVLEQGGKTAKFQQFQGQVRVEVAEEILLPPNPSGQGLPAYARKGSRPRVAVQSDGVVYEGREENSYYGQEYVVDLGDGIEAVYHPQSKDVPYSLRGTLEVICPVGPKDMATVGMEKLRLLHLNAEPADRVEAEAMYLERNVWAQGYLQDPGYKAVREKLEFLAQRREAQDVARLEAAGMEGLGKEERLALAKEVVLRGRRDLLKEKVGLLRGFFEAKLGLPAGGLSKLPAYQPLPDGAGPEGTGYFNWNRFDYTREKVRGAMQGKAIGHRLVGGKQDKVRALCRIIEGGGILACTEMRSRMGIKDVGMSPWEDMKTGGASYTFCRVADAKDECKHMDIVWQPEDVLTRSDWFAYPHDHFGATNPDDHRYSPGARAGDVEKLKTFADPTNEVMFKNGIGLFGQHAPSRIWVDTQAARKRVLTSFAKAGVKELNGRPVEEVVKVR
ncbi:MAG: hypothetical protein M0031_03420 [Thermaerobacter sp.]|nr:hypothetical protein [Thermaerobacter sp.]